MILVLEQLVISASHGSCICCFVTEFFQLYGHWNTLHTCRLTLQKARGRGRLLCGLDLPFRVHSFPIVGARAWDARTRVAVVGRGNVDRLDSNHLLPLRACCRVRDGEGGESTRPCGALPLGYGRHRIRLPVDAGRLRSSIQCRYRPPTVS